MTKRLRYERIIADIANLESSFPKKSLADPFANISYKNRKAALTDEIEAIEKDPETLASVALIFDGGPVEASRSIDAGFAAGALTEFQKMITGQWASSGERALNRKGPISSAKSSHLRMTGIVHGSFGFLLEETDFDRPPMFDSSLKEATDKVLKLIDGFAGVDDEAFSTVLNEMDSRIFTSLKRFIKSLHREGASLRLLENMEEVNIGGERLQRAFDRIESVTATEDEFVISATLIGVTPIHREFELRANNDQQLITGRFDENISQDFLERIEREELALGQSWSVRLRKTEIRKLEGSVKVTYVMTSITKED